MERKIGYMITFMVFMLSACGDDEESNGDVDNKNIEQAEGSDELESGDVEPEVSSALLGHDLFSLQKNAAEIIDNEKVHSDLRVNLEIDDANRDALIGKAEEGTENIADMLSDVDVIQSADVQWQYDYSSSYYTFELEREDGKLVIKDEELSEEGLDRHLYDPSENED